MKIIVDAMGGDHAPFEIVKGAVEAVEDNQTEVILVGDKNVIQPLLPSSSSNSRLSIVNATEIITSDEHPIKTVRTKRRSSIVVGLNLLKHGGGAAFVSAGSTGAIVSASIFILHKIKGVDRPALAAPLPTPSRFCLLLDVGANADCKPAFLVNFAQLGKLYMEKIFGVDNPRVGLLTTGEEKMKGNRLARETHKLLTTTNLNFIGNIEGKDITRGLVDIIITDGFTGNMVLKVMEGFGENLFDFFEQILAGDARYQQSAPLFKLALGSFVKRFNYSEHGGAPLLGVNGNVIITHGRSRAKAIKNAIYLAQRTAEFRLTETIAEGFSEQEKQASLSQTKLSRAIDTSSLTQELG